MSEFPAKTLDDLAWRQILDELARRCHTEAGAEAARALAFLPERAAAEARIAEVAELRALRDRGEPAPFGGLIDVSTVLVRAGKGAVLEPEELVAVGSTARACGRLRSHLLRHRELAPRVAARARAIPELARVGGAMLDAFDDDGKLADHASPELGKLRRKARGLHEEAMRRYKAVLDDPKIAPALQDTFYTQREDRYVLPLRSDRHTDVPGIVHGTSQTGATLFVEPEQFVGLNNRLKIAELAVSEEERRIMTELSGLVRAEAESVAAATAIALALDVLDGAARLADDMHATAPILEPEDGPLSLRAARHPQMALGARACIPNDIELAAGTTLVISGPNAGGKTVALKTAGTAVLLARAGLHVPAGSGSRVPWLRVVHSDIGDDQSLERDLSTFSAHVLRLREVLADADGGALVLIDEVAVGTAPEQGAALAQAVLEALADRGARAMVTTHYERVKAIAATDARFHNGSVGFDMETMQPTYRLTIGAPGASGGLIVARKLGLPDAVVARAEALLGAERADVDGLIASIEDRQRELDAERARIDARAAELDRELRAAEHAREQAEERARKAQHTAHDEAIDALRRARAEADRLRKAVKRRRAAEAGAQLNELSRSIAEHAPERPVQGAEVAAEQLAPGVRVMVPALGGRGEVVEAPRGGKVTVRVGSLKTTVPVEGVRLDTSKPAQAATSSKPKPKPKPAAPATRQPQLVEHRDDLAPARTIDNTVDVRGERAEIAMRAVEKFVDESMLAMRDVVFVIHGHGTGALRSAVREVAGSHPAVTRWRPGTAREGGEGVTILWLDV